MVSLSEFTFWLQGQVYLQNNDCIASVMLYSERKVDAIRNIDASSDVQKGSFRQHVSQISYRRSPDFKRRHKIKHNLNISNLDCFWGLYVQAYDGTPMSHRPETVCRQDSPGCTMVYLPLLPNERAVPGYDSSSAKFSGSYNLVWTPEQVEMIVRTSAANFRAGQGTVEGFLREAWLRKRAAAGLVL